MPEVKSRQMTGVFWVWKLAVAWQRDLAYFRWMRMLAFRVMARRQIRMIDARRIQVMTFGRARMIACSDTD